MAEDQSICLAIVEKVAEHEGTSAEDLQLPLHSAIDTDALDSLFQEPDREYPSVEFTYRGYTIRVDGPDEIAIDDPTSETHSRAGIVSGD